MMENLTVPGDRLPARQGRITDHPLQAPGLAIIDRDRTIRYLHRGRTLGDYRTLATVVDTVSELAAAGRPTD